MDEYLNVMNGGVVSWSAANIPPTPVPPAPQGVKTVQHTTIVNPIPLVEDPREFITFESKAAVLKTKIRAAVEHKLIELPYDLGKEIKSRCILSGSSISSLYHNEKPKDYDLWARDDIDLIFLKDELNKNHEFIAEYSDKYNELLNVMPKEGETKKLITDNAITLTNGMQFITLGTYEVCRKSFDLKHCLPYYILATDTFVISSHQMDLIARRRLEKVDPNSVMKGYRLDKFVKRGWTF